MWFADLYYDFDWIFARNGILGEARSTLRGGKSASLGIDIDFRFFGDDERLRHVRMLMKTEDQQVAEKCLNLNIQAWSASLESAVLLLGQRPAQFESIAGPQTITVALGS